MLVIGLAGGIASGKTLVARCFEYFGAAVLNADRMGHEVLRDPEVIAAIVSQWGTSVLTDGEINRGALGRIVFGSALDDSGPLGILERITHPRIGDRIQQRLTELKRESVPAVVFDAPVMFKAGWDRMCDRIVFVESELAIRQQRASQRGWEPDEIVRRESRQTPIDEKRLHSTDFIDNSKSKTGTIQQAHQLWCQWNLPLPAGLDFSKILLPI